MGETFKAFQAYSNTIHLLEVLDSETRKWRHKDLCLCTLEMNLQINYRMAQCIHKLAKYRWIFKNVIYLYRPGYMTQNNCLVYCKEVIQCSNGTTGRTCIRWGWEPQPKAASLKWPGGQAWTPAFPSALTSGTSEPQVECRLALHPARNVGIILLQTSPAEEPSMFSPTLGVNLVNHEFFSQETDDQLVRTTPKVSPHYYSEVRGHAGARLGPAKQLSQV